jgi:hypothetical protein
MTTTNLFAGLEDPQPPQAAQAPQAPDVAPTAPDVAPVAATEAAPVAVALAAAPAPAVAPLTDAEYFELAYLSGSDLRAGYSCPDDAAWRRATPAKSDAMTIGTAVHMALLEPIRFAEEVVVRPDDIDGRTKAGKEWLAENAGRIVMAREMHDRARAYAGAFTTALAAIGIDPIGWWLDYERGIVWSEAFGRCRCKPDLLAVQPTPAAPATAEGAPGTPGRVVNVSLKTTAKPLSSAQWTSQVVSGALGAGYDLPEYHYARGIAAQVLGDVERWREVETWHVIATTTGAPRLAVARVPDDIMERASRLWADRAPVIAAAVANGLQGVVMEALTIALPRWADSAMPDAFGDDGGDA